MDARVQVYSDKMQKAYEFLEADFAAIRAGRANPHVLDKLRVDYYGTPTPIQQVGNVTVPEARIIQIAPWEKSLIKEIEKAIMTSDIGINPSNDGSVIRLVFPELTEERRKDLVKEVKKKGEEGKVAIRNIRRDGNDAFKKLAKTEVSEDEIKGLEDDLQKLTDKYVTDAFDKTLLPGIACFAGFRDAVQRLQAVYGRNHRYEDRHVDIAGRKYAEHHRQLYPYQRQTGLPGAGVAGSRHQYVVLAYYDGGGVRVDCAARPPLYPLPDRVLPHGMVVSGVQETQCTGLACRFADGNGDGLFQP